MTVQMIITPREGISLVIDVDNVAELIHELDTAGITNALPIQTKEESQTLL